MRGIISAKCPICGATIKINAETKLLTLICQYCGSEFFVEEVNKPENISTLLENADNYYKHGKVLDAIKCCYKVLQLEPNNIMARNKIKKMKSFDSHFEKRNIKDLYDSDGELQTALLRNYVLLKSIDSTESYSEKLSLGVFTRRYSSGILGIYKPLSNLDEALINLAKNSLEHAVKKENITYEFKYLAPAGKTTKCDGYFNEYISINGKYKRCTLRRETLYAIITITKNDINQLHRNVLNQKQQFQHKYHDFIQDVVKILKNNIWLSFGDDAVCHDANSPSDGMWYTGYGIQKLDVVSAYGLALAVLDEIQKDTPLNWRVITDYSSIYLYQS